MGQPADPAAAQGLIIIGVASIILVLVLLRMSLARWGATGRRFVIPEYTPPVGLNVMVAAHLVGRSRSAVPAQLLQLAVQKNIRVLDRALRRGRHAYAVQFVSLDGADEIGRHMLVALFGENPAAGAVRELRATNYRMRNNVSDVSAHAFAVARQRGWRRSASVGQWFNLVTAIGLEVYVLAVSIILWAVHLFSPLFVVAFFVAPAALIASALSVRLYGPLTDEGAVVRDHVVGLRIYLELAEEQRLQMLQGALTAERQSRAGGLVAIRVYEKLLPYAIVWKVERSWIAALIGDAIDLDRPPDWVSDLNQLSAVNSVNILWRWSTRTFSGMRPALAGLRATDARGGWLRPPPQA